MADLAHATENDTDLHGDPDARHWVERFQYVRDRQLAEAGRDIADSEGAMLAWFAGAIETGRMAAGYPPPGEGKPGVLRRLSAEEVAGYAPMHRELAGFDLSWVIGFVYDSMAAADYYRSANVNVHGHAVVGPLQIDGLGIVCLIRSRYPTAEQ
jgi:hypothetical protein